MSTMNILSITLIVLILASGIALFFGIRAAQANEIEYPVFAADPAAESLVVASLKDDGATPNLEH